jgi:thioredoxin 1
MGDLLAVSDADFDAKILAAKGQSVVEFGAPWCAPCKALEPTLKAIATERSAVKIYKIDADENPEAAERYGVRGLPTILFFKDGELVDRLVGNQSKANLEKVLARHA